AVLGALEELAARLQTLAELAELLEGILGIDLHAHGAGHLRSASGAPAPWLRARDDAWRALRASIPSRLAAPRPSRCAWGCDESRRTTRRSPARPGGSRSRT